MIDYLKIQALLLDLDGSLLTVRKLFIKRLNQH